MKERHTWREGSIPNRRGQQLFCRHYFTSVEAPNILYIQTPLSSVGGMTKKAYEPLAKYGFNIFAVDLAGIGQSEGCINVFTASGIISDLDSCVDYIKENHGGKLYLYGGTGIGGIVGQYYASYSNRLDAFAQFGAGIYKDLSPMGLPLWLGQLCYGMVKLLRKVAPNLSLKMKPPKYSGKNKEMDDRFYEMALAENPDLFKANMNWLAVLMDIFLSKDSFLQKEPTCPILVFQTLSDRYFPADYFKGYYDSLTHPKRLYTIDDIHNSYYYRSDEICEQVAKWFLDNHKEVALDA